MTIHTLFLIILCFLLGGIFVRASFVRKSKVNWITICIGLWFIALPICIICEWSKAFMLLLCVPLGTLCTIMAIVGITRPLRYCVKAEGVYIKLQRRGWLSSFYHLECRFHSNGKGYQRVSEDFYTLRQWQKKYVEGTTFTIWIHKKDPMKFQVKRFFGVPANILMLFLGIGFWELAGRIVFKILAS